MASVNGYTTEFADTDGTWKFGNESVNLKSLIKRTRLWAEHKASEWRIVRNSDGIVIAYSDNAYATPTSTPETVASAAPVAAQAEPVADADLPFAEGMGDSEQGSEQRVIETTPAQLVAAILGLPVTSERATIWTHNADDTPFPFITDWRKCHQAAWLFAERGAVTGHGRKAKSTVKGHKRVKSPKNGVQVMMQRKTPQIEEIKANYRQQQQAVAYRKQQAIIQLFQQAWAVGKAA